MRTRVAEPPRLRKITQADGRAELAVLNGNVHVDAPSGAMDVGKKKTLTIPLLNPTAASMAKHVAFAPDDAWDQSAIDYHDHYANTGAFGNPPQAFGISDMLYYGHFVNAAGCDRLWRPYLASAAWDPFANGKWVWYPGWGYSWVSPYPWGWTPYHSGAWKYCPAYGWGWRPRGAFVGLLNPPKSRIPGRYPPPRPRPRPPLPPALGAPTRVAVNREPPVASGLASPNTFVIRRDSAGLGVPRSTFGNLNHESGRVDQRGSDRIAVNSGPITVERGSGSGHESVASSGSASVSLTRTSGYSGGYSRTSSYSSSAGQSYSGSGERGAGASGSASSSQAGGGHR
jgi:hypothetical protein